MINNIRSIKTASTVLATFALFSWLIVALLKPVKFPALVQNNILFISLCLLTISYLLLIIYYWKRREPGEIRNLIFYLLLITAILLLLFFLR